MAMIPAARIEMLEVIRDKLGLECLPLAARLKIGREELVTIEVEVPVTVELEAGLAAVARRYALVPA